MVTRVKTLATHPKVSGEVYAACEVFVDNQSTSNTVFRSTNAGQTWTQIQNPLDSAPSSLVFLATPKGMGLYAGTWNGAGLSLNDGSSWTAIDGLPAGQVYDMAGAADSDRSVIYVSSAAGMIASSAGLRASAQTLMVGAPMGCPSGC
jgi:photosystem II stability/assembly factor-like uncharacterized protein